MALVSPYTDNSSRNIVSTDFGIKISKPGFSAAGTAGQNLVFSSSWPSLPIAFEQNFSTGTTRVAHNLGFPPFAMQWTVANDPSGISNAATRNIVPVDSTYAYVTAGSSTNNLKCFNIDLTKDINYTLAPGDTTKGTYDPNYGIKVAKDGKSIHSTDLRNYALHSRCQSPLILAVKTEATIPSANVGTSIGNVIQFTNKLGYPVWVYGYIKIGSTLATSLGYTENTYLPAPYYSQAYPRTFTDGISTYLGYTSGDNGATIVVLRDPMFASTTVNAQY